MKVLKFIPLFFIILVAYNILAFMDGDDVKSIFDWVVISFRLISGAEFRLNLADLFIVIGLNALYFEVFKSIRTSLSAMVDHALSMVVFIIFLVEFIVVKQVGTPTFFILTVMSLLDVMAGFTITISSARRDISVEG